MSLQANKFEYQHHNGNAATTKVKKIQHGGTISFRLAMFVCFVSCCYATLMACSESRFACSKTPSKCFHLVSSLQCAKCLKKSSKTLASFELFAKSHSATFALFHSGKFLFNFISLIFVLFSSQCLKVLYATMNHREVVLCFVSVAA